MKYFFISDGQQKIGPYSAEEITRLVLDCKLSLLDQVYDSRTREWLPATEVGKGPSAGASSEAGEGAGNGTKSGTLFIASDGVADQPTDEHTKTVLGLATTATSMGEARGTKATKTTTQRSAVVVQATQIAAPTVPPPTAGPAQVRWYLKESKIVLGPYTFAAMLGMIIDGTIREHDYVCRDGDAEWVMAKECKDFALDQLKQMTNEGAAAKIVARGGFKRRHARKDVNEDIIVHARGSIHNVVMGDISVGGCSVIANMPLFSEGEEIVLSIFEKANAPAGGIRFNAKGIVVRVVRRRGEEMHKHSIRFTAVTQQLMDRIKQRLVS